MMELADLTLFFCVGINSQPFRIDEEGWGEFDMQIVLSGADKDHTITHDLNFQKNKYEAKHQLVSFRPRSCWMNGHLVFTN